ncbi:ATP-dependent sacrificial sulfur transferase LarE [Thalassoroseus pseudoceratinae]|uniref:ATP-dependent sacrificial sulfur transferase LarE n=1 Tax=Thalassoroseus pseudoceratinae TaxID=2713176 RepID=UPI00141DA325|nr:ATP-dependent sacrificial sulfur transferase LarE [Thalassoroseus pseudoceratinae]
MPSPTVLDTKRDRLIEILQGYEHVVVAFSAGVDSTVVAKAAWLACGENAEAVTAVSSSLASGELDEAKELAAKIGIRHRVIHTQEFANSDYAKNAPDRCYFCKTELYDQLERLLSESVGNDVVIVNGANLDDRGDHRPGMRAASEHHVRSPLIEAGLNKTDVRELARSWDLPVWDKPAMPCLSSRIAYGVEVTPERVRRVDAAEQFLRQTFGFREFRVRHEAGELARIEVPLADLPTLLEPSHRERVTAEFKRLGFRFVTVDLEGFRSGSLNVVIPVEQLQRFSS